MKTALFIDAANLHITARSLGFDINFKSLRDHFKEGLIRAYYFTAIRESEEADGHQSIRPLLDWLDYNGYTMVTKPSKSWANADGSKKTKGNMDIELAVCAMELRNHIDHAIIFSGDGDFKSLVISLQKSGVSVTVVSSIETKPPQCADELRRAADTFIDLATIIEKISQKKVSRYG